MKLIGFVVALLGVLEPAAASEKGLKKKINEKIGNLNSFYWRPNEDEPKVLCGMCRDKTDQDMNAKCNYKTGNCPDIQNGQRCMKGKFYKEQGYTYRSIDVVRVFYYYNHII